MQEVKVSANAAVVGIRALTHYMGMHADRLSEVELRELQEVLDALTYADRITFAYDEDGIEKGEKILG